MRFLSLFSGIEAASMAWLPLGWECVGVAEIEPFPCAVLAHHYPHVPNLGDITKITEGQIKDLGHIDLIVGGFPCQDLSVAGKRKGLKNEDGTSTRSGLFFDAMRIVRYAEPRFLLIENVPGIYSSNSGRDFASVVGEILGVEFGVPLNGWGNTGVAASERGLLEWATLDAQFFGVPQRRRRMFALADFGDWQTREPVLFERHSLQGHPTPQRQAGESVAGTISKCSFDGGAGGRPEGAVAGHFQVVKQTPYRMLGFSDYVHDELASTMKSRDGKDSTDLITYGIQANIIGRQDHNGGNGMGVSEGIAPTLTKADQHGVAVIHGTQDPCVSDVAFALGRNSGQKNAIAFVQNSRDEVRLMGGDGQLVGALAANAGAKQQCYVAQQHAQVRRLTPRECERLQGFSDDWTLIPVGKKMAADGPRYKALGNSMAVPVMHWIGSRIAQVEAITSKVAA